MTQNDHSATNRKMVTAITGTACSSMLFLMFLLIWGDPAPAGPSVPWFVPFVNSFNAITFLAVGFLAMGRHAALRDPSSFWIGIGAICFSVMQIFRTLSWPGLLPGGGAIIGSTIGLTAWFLQIGITIFSCLLVLSATLSRPKSESPAHGRVLILAGAWIVLLIVGSSLVIIAEPHLPSLVEPSGSFSATLLTWNLLVGTVFAAGAALSTRRHVQSGDVLVGYMAIVQMGFAVAIFATLIGIRRYDLWWYLTRIIPTGTALVAFFGLLYEYVQLFQLEREKSDRILSAEEELLQGEKRFEALVTASSEVLYRMSPDWSEMRQLLSRGFLTDTEKNRNWLEEYIHPADQVRVIQAVREAIRTKSIFVFEHRVVRVDGSLGWTLSRAVPLMDANGEIVEWFGAASDITDRMKAEQGLKELTQTLEQQVIERTELAETRSRQLHQLAVELIEAEERERNRISVLLHEDLQQILASARIQLQSVQQLLPPEAKLENIVRLLEESIVKSRNLSQELSPAILNHSDLPTALKWLTRRMSEQFDLSIDLDIRNEQTIEHMPVDVFIFRAVQELLFNVIKHAGVKSARVLLSTSGQSIIVTVSDEGKGFDPAMLDHSKGGLGLLSLRERSSYIKGSLEIDSSPGNGTRINLSIPFNLTPIKVPGGQEREPWTPAGAAKIPTRNGDVRVLFVDDHKVMRQGLIRLVSGQPGIGIGGEASNGKEALELARLIKPDVIVMDISMPEMDGIEATWRIKTELPDIRVIGLSMHDDENIREAMRKAGAEGFVQKTASASELLKAIYGNGRI
jgi:PAS domain S-box-containing protein